MNLTASRTIKTTFGALLTTAAVLGGIHGNTMTAQALEDLAAEQRVAAFVTETVALQDAHTATAARTILADFQPTIDAATALVESSDGKASAESRSALSSLVTEYNNQVDQPFTSATEYRDAAESLTATAALALASATDTVNAEVAAWQVAEDARIEAERIAAEEAARQAETERRNSGGSSDSGNRNSGGSSNNGGSSNGGGGSTAERWRQIAADNGIHCFSIIPGSTSYYKGGCIQIAQAPLDAGAERVLWHEIAHHKTAGTYRVQCAYISQDLSGLKGNNLEVWAQAYTQLYYGWSADWAYAPASQSYIDGMVNAGCL